MNDALPIWIVEPEQSDKRDLAALKLSRGGQKSAHIPHSVAVADLKNELRHLRESARDNVDSLAARFQASVKERYPSAHVQFADDAADAVEYVTRSAGETRTISTNNSVGVNELKRGLVENGFTVINSYHHEFEVKEKRVQDYWDLPRLLDHSLKSTFDVAVKIEGLLRGESLKYIAMLGVNAASADDGTVVFLEHFSNIRRDLERAEKVVLVVGLDKIVASRAEAIFQAQCMGVFGAENILLGIEPERAPAPSIEDLRLPAGLEDRELHVVVLDNGRRKLTHGEFKDLFLCIGCRACNKHCPIRHAFNTDYIWTPKTYLTQFMRGASDSVDVCLHCEACRLECPLDIDLPYLIWQAKLDHIAAHGTSLSHKILGRPELLAKLGTSVAPLSNWAMGMALVRVPMESVSGIDRRTKLPRFHRKTFKKSVKR